MTLQQLYYFREVAQTQHFTKAAENLYVSQSSLSHAILTLERELGVTLFIRSNGKRVTLTRFGRELLPYVEKTLADAEEIERVAQQERNPMSGAVVVAYSFINGYTLIPEVFEGFISNKRNENIVIDFDITHNTRPTEERVLAGDVDIAFNCTDGVAGISTYPFAKQQLYLFLPYNHPLAEEKKLSICDIKDEQIIYYHPVSELHRRIIRMYENEGVLPNEAACYHDWASQMAAVSLGLGIGICPKLPVDNDRIRVVPLDDPLAIRTIYMLWATDREQPAYVEYVKKYCIDFSKNHLMIT